MSINYSCTNENQDFSHSFINTYIELFGEIYTHVHRHSFITKNKINIDLIRKLVKNSFKNYNFDVEYSSIIRGLSVFDYEDITEDDELCTADSLKKASNEMEYVDYVDYMYFFDKVNKLGVNVLYTNRILQIGVVSHEYESSKTLFDILHDSVRQLKKNDKSKNKINFICRNQQGFYLEELKLKLTNTFDIENHYNDAFVPVSNHIEAMLNKDNSKGIILLYGVPGTGKTSYLRYLIQALNKNIIYVSPEMATAISEPAFLSFLMNHKNSILIIEDAENVLQTRESGANQAVANLLNVTDGILGDGLNFQVVCTFNTELMNIDKALRRPGRLIAEYEFTTLSLDKTNSLIKILYGEDSKKVEKCMTLAEIFNMKDPEYLHETKVESKPFGFIR